MRIKEALLRADEGYTTVSVRPLSSSKTQSLNNRVVAAVGGERSSDGDNENSRMQMTPGGTWFIN